MIPFVHRRAWIASLILALIAFVGCGQGEGPPSPGPKAGQTTREDGAKPAPPKVDGPPKDDREEWPTEAEAKAAIFKVEYAIHASETNKSVWKVKDMKHEVKSVKFAPKTVQKQMNFGVSAITVYPVKILYTRVTEYEHKAATREEQGADGVWYLYRDSFGEWTGKYGNP